MDSAIETLLYQESGLLGVSGVSERYACAPRARSRGRSSPSICSCIASGELGSLAAALGGLDAIVFTAGIGEHAVAVRAAVCRQAAWLGVDLDTQANTAGGPRLSTASSRVAVWVIPTNEELMIARHTRALAG